MHHKGILGIITFCMFIIIGGSIRYYSIISSTKQPSQVCCNATCFTVELAQTPEERQYGLMFRETLPDDTGMLFIFPTEDIYSFWMKNTLIPLDMIWINANLNIVDIQKADPCKQDPCPLYVPEKQAQYILELNQGMSLANEIQIGDQCSLLL